MSFIGDVKQGKTYAPGYFLAHEECTRETREMPASGDLVTTTSEGAKYVKMGTVFPSNDGNAVGIVYEDVDVSTGAMPGSVVTAGEVYEDRLPASVQSAAKSALTGIRFVSDPSVIRPDYPTSLVTLTVTFAEASASGKTAPTVSGYTLKTGDKYLFKLGTGTSATNAPKVDAGEILSTGWTAWDGTSAITVAAGDDGKYATIAVVNAFGEAIAAGSGAVDRKS